MKVLLTIWLTAFSAFGQQLDSLYTVYWGNAKPGDEASIEERILDVRHGKTGAVLNNIRIEKWHVQVGENLLSGVGDVLSTDVKRLIVAQRKDSVFVEMKIWYRHLNAHEVHHLKGSFFVRTFQNWDNAQHAFIVIDRTPKNFTAVFDSNNPFSFVSLLAQNSLPDFEGFNEQAQARMNERKQEYFTQELTWNSPIRLYAHHSNRELLRDSICMDSTGQLKFGYASPQKTNYDFRECDRVLLFVDQVTDSNEVKKWVIKRVAMARKFANETKSEIVMSMDYPTFLNSKDLWSSVELDEGASNRLLTTDFPFWKAVKDSSLSDSMRHAHRFFNVMYFRAYGLSNRNKNQVGSDHLPEYFVNPVYNMKPDELKACFDSLRFFYGPEYDIPLTDENGDPIEFVSPDGLITYAYPEPDIFYYWVEDDSLKLRLHYVANTDGHYGDTMHLIALEAYKPSEKGDLVCVTWFISGTPYAKLFQETLPDQPLMIVPEFAAYFQKELRKNKIFIQGSAKTKKYLDRNFYLDQYLGYDLTPFRF